MRSGGQGSTHHSQSAEWSAGHRNLARDDINLEATGRVERAKQLSATGWRSDADALNVTLNLPPGWRLFALFGADWVRGDWLTAWTLLDLFLLLIFSLAVFRLWVLGAVRAGISSLRAFLSRTGRSALCLACPPDADRSSSCRSPQDGDAAWSTSGNGSPSRRSFLLLSPLYQAGAAGPLSTTGKRQAVARDPTRNELRGETSGEAPAAFRSQPAPGGRDRWTPQSRARKARLDGLHRTRRPRKQFDVPKPMLVSRRVPAFLNGVGEP